MTFIIIYGVLESALSPAYHCLMWIINRCDILCILQKSLVVISWSWWFKGFCFVYYYCTTNICPFNTARSDRLERKSILHLESPASELTEPVSYHNTHLILTSLAIQPLSVIIACKVWAYRGIIMSQHPELNPDSKNIHAINCTVLCWQTNCSLFLYKPSADLVDQIILRETPSSIIWQGFPEQE